MIITLLILIADLRLLATRLAWYVLITLCSLLLLTLCFSLFHLALSSSSGVGPALEQDECVDIIAVTKGHGLEGV